MITRTLSRTALLAGALAVVASAHSYMFEVLGTCDSAGTITSTTYKFSSLSEFGNTFDYFVQLDFSGNYAAWFNNGASHIDLSGTGGAVNNSGTSYSFSGVYTVTSATSTSVPVGSTGTYSATFDLSAGYFSYSASGSPVPEPASMAVLGLGAVAVMRRRRRS